MVTDVFILPDKLAEYIAMVMPVGARDARHAGVSCGARFPRTRRTQATSGSSTGGPRRPSGYSNAGEAKPWFAEYVPKKLAAIADKSKGPLLLGEVVRLCGLERPQPIMILARWRDSVGMERP
ncbi:hypothetical protein CLCR_10911 [Cladophialophora carrionii]|uniref:Uncharacterized protein n=1 Tax=Cladophialophora carrionii TaxID=86049 RepID=A0A1C1CYF9_9EURO|nr:hypothetical protein CLCR_10911 [Cladophialophora carrionii]